MVYSLRSVFICITVLFLDETDISNFVKLRSPAPLRALTARLENKIHKNHETKNWLRLKYMILLTRELTDNKLCVWWMVELDTAAAGWLCWYLWDAWDVRLGTVTCVRWPASDQYKVSPPSNCIFIIIWPPPATASSPAVSNHKTRLQPEKSMIKKCLDFSSGTRRHLEESILNMWPTGVCDLCLKTS